MQPIGVLDTEEELSSWHYEQLEAGRIIVFHKTPIELSKEDYEFLLSQRQTDAAYHKNIAYRPLEDKVTGLARRGALRQLRRILGSYSDQAVRLLSRLLPRYAERWQIDFTSFRPFEEAGRQLSLHSRNDLLHVDAFPTRPTHGDRILRFFTNFNLRQPRVWLTSDPFDRLVESFASQAGLVEKARRLSTPSRHTAARLGRRMRLPLLRRSPYDDLMHRFHNFLKENAQFQESCSKVRVEFPPRASWLVFTDMASHAVLSGQFALEQTLIISRQAMLQPEKAPISILERLTGVPLTWRS